MKVYLVGFMGSGKTTAGRALSAFFNTPFLDLDEQITRHTGLGIAEIFAAYGEAHFRTLEREVLWETRHLPPGTIIATGGGTPCFFDNMDWMNHHGLTLWLDVPVEILVKRLENEREKRPLLHNIPEEWFAETLKTRLALREPCYRRASERIAGGQIEAIRLYLSSRFGI